MAVVEPRDGFCRWLLSTLIKGRPLCFVFGGFCASGESLYLVCLFVFDRKRPMKTARWWPAAILLLGLALVGANGRPSMEEFREPPYRAVVRFRHKVLTAVRLHPPLKTRGPFALYQSGKEQPWDAPTTSDNQLPRLVFMPQAALNTPRVIAITFSVGTESRERAREKQIPL